MPILRVKSSGDFDYDANNCGKRQPQYQVSVLTKNKNPVLLSSRSLQTVVRERKTFSKTSSLERKKTICQVFCCSCLPSLAEPGFFAEPGFIAGGRV